MDAVSNYRNRKSAHTCPAKLLGMFGEVFQGEPVGISVDWVTTCTSGGIVVTSCVTSGAICGGPSICGGGPFCVCTSRGGGCAVKTKK